MARWADDPEAAAAALVAPVLDALGNPRRILLVNQHTDLELRATAAGHHVSVWNRRTFGREPASPWPPAGPFETACLRLAKSRAEQDMTLHAVLSVLAPGGRLVLYGGNDEGIRSAERHAAKLLGPADVLATRGHGRVVAWVRDPVIAGLRRTFAEWRTVTPLVLDGHAVDWISYPGLFAAGTLDEGTGLLLAHLPALAAGARVLDFGCGPGMISAALRQGRPDMVLTLVDNDTVALAAAAENVPDVELVLGADLGVVDGRVFDAIVSNPPLHAGVREDHRFLERLVADAPARLASGASLTLVVQRRVAMQDMLAKVFRHVDVLADDGRFRVWQARA